MRVDESDGIRRRVRVAASLFSFLSAQARKSYSITLSVSCVSGGSPASRKVNEARRPHTCSRPCAFEVRRKKRKKKHEISPGPKHTTKSTAARRPRPPETVCDETRPTRELMLARFGIHRSRVCGKSASYNSRNQ